MLKTTLCRQLGIEYPLFSAGMGGGMAGPELVAAVSNAGACGVLGMGGLPAPYIRQQIQQTRTLTNKPFGVNLLLPILQEGQIDTCLAEHVPILVLFWGDPEPYVREAHRRGTKVFIQVGSVGEAQAAARAGVDAIIAQGVEAGGHVKSTVALSTIVPTVVEAVMPVPVIAAGGIATGRGLVAALSLGARAVSLGTRFLASEETRVARLEEGGHRGGRQAARRPVEQRRDEPAIRCGGIPHGGLRVTAWRRRTARQGRPAFRLLHRPKTVSGAPPASAAGGAQ